MDRNYETCSSKPAQRVLDYGPLKYHLDIPVVLTKPHPTKPGVTQRLRTIELFKNVVEVDGKFKLWFTKFE